MNELVLPYSVLTVDGGMHPLNNPIHSISSHYEGVMLEDAVNIEALHSEIF